MTAAENILSNWRALVEHLAAIPPWQAAANLGLSVAAVAAAFALAVLIGRLLQAAVRRLPGSGAAEQTLRAARITRLTAWSVRLLCAAAAVALVLEIWGVDLASVSGVLSGGIAAAALHLLLIFLIATAAFEISDYAIARLFSGVAASASEVRRKAQLRTLGPLLQGIARAVIVTVAALMALSEIGVNIGPLIAGAGVVGIALGFGAQSLVKDFLTGVFLILEDIVSVGDIVRIGSSGGLVEEMTLRTIRLRDFDGTLHVFPYSEAQVVHNLTKTFSCYVFDLQISYDSDIDEALRIMERVGAELQADPTFAEQILEPIEVVGVDNLADSGLVLKARIKTRPSQQWSVGREYNRRIKLAFDRAGVEIPFPHMKVVLPDQQLAELAGHA